VRGLGYGAAYLPAKWHMALKGITALPLTPALSRREREQTHTAHRVGRYTVPS
jgi:hypothetical protein